MKKLPIYGITEFSEADMVHSFYANDLRKHLESHRFVNAPHKHSTYIAVLFTEGTGTHYIDFNTYAVRAGSIFLLTPGQVHSWELSDDVEGYVFFHTQEFYNEVYLSKKLTHFPFFYLQTNHPVIYLEERELTAVKTLFQAVLEEHRLNDLFKYGKLVSLVDLVYIQLARVYREGSLMADKQHGHYARIKQLEKLIDEHFKTKKLPKAYADLMHMTTRHLNRICQETLQQPTGSLILKRVMIEARRMLIHSDINVTTLAEELGYPDYSYFIRLFKQYVGESPKKFQRRMIQASSIS